jgi:acyl carrier protein
VTEASEDSVRQLLAAFLKLPPARLLPDTRLDELGLDSLAAVELIFEIEERFGVRVPNERVAEFRSVRAIVEGVRALQTQAASA